MKSPKKPKKIRGHIFGTGSQSHYIEDNYCRSTHSLWAVASSHLTTYSMRLIIRSEILNDDLLLDHRLRMPPLICHEVCVRIYDTKSGEQRAKKFYERECWIVRRRSFLNLQKRIIIGHFGRYNIWILKMAPVL